MHDQPSILIVSDMFPPTCAVGVHRVIGVCRHLSTHGWRVSVVTPRATADLPADLALLSAVPAEVQVVRTVAPDLLRVVARLVKGDPNRKQKASVASKPVPNDGPPAEPQSSSAAKPDSRPGRARRTIDWLSRWLRVPDGRSGWLLPAIWSGVREGRRSQAQVVFSSGPGWTSMVAGAAVSKCLGIPFVADFRDPWCGSEFRSSSYAAHRKVNEFFERWLVKRASKITCAWDGIRTHLSKRYPHRAADMTTIVNGFDPDSIAAPAAQRLDAGSTARVFLHTGSFYGPRSPIPLFQALKQMAIAGDAVPGQIVFGFVGPTEYDGRDLRDLAREHGVEDQIRIVPRVSHREAIGLLKGADAAILCGQNGTDTLASIPAKAYEYIGTEKPVLAVGAGGEVCEVLRQGGCQVWDAAANDPARIVSAVRAMVEFLDQPGDIAARSGSGKSKFTRAQMAARIEQVLKAVCPQPSASAQVHANA